MLDNLTPSLIVTSSAPEHEPLTNNTDKSLNTTVSLVYKIKVSSFLYI